MIFAFLDAVLFAECFTAEKGIFLTPTLAVHQLISSPPWRKFVLPEQVAKNELVRVAGLKA